MHIHFWGGFVEDGNGSWTGKKIKLVRLRLVLLKLWQACSVKALTGLFCWKFKKSLFFIRFWVFFYVTRLPRHPLNKKLSFHMKPKVFPKCLTSVINSFFQIRRKKQKKLPCHHSPTLPLPTSEGFSVEVYLTEALKSFYDSDLFIKMNEQC